MEFSIEDSNVLKRWESRKRSINHILSKLLSLSFLRTEDFSSVLDIDCYPLGFSTKSIAYFCSDNSIRTNILGIDRDFNSYKSTIFDKNVLKGGVINKNVNFSFKKCDYRELIDSFRFISVFGYWRDSDFMNNNFHDWVIGSDVVIVTCFNKLMLKGWFENFSGTGFSSVFFMGSELFTGLDEWDCYVVLIAKDKSRFSNFMGFSFDKFNL